MKKFFEEYGGVTLGICAVLVLIAMVSPVGATIKNSLTGIVNGFSESLTEGFSGATGGSDSSEDSGGDSKVTQTVISESDSYIGKYADVDGDGIVDGVIFADLAFSNSGTWGSEPSFGVWGYSASTNLKQYYVSQTSYTAPYDFGEQEVISLVDGTTGNDRFYVMALEDVDNIECFWYYTAYSNKISDYNTVTSQDFGSGKQNTTTMISKWNSSTYGSQNRNSDYTDMWGAIQTQANNGWFVPSRAEWAAFGSNLDITKSNYSSYGLSFYYWSSSLSDSNRAYYVDFNYGSMSCDGLGGNIYVRLAKTF